MSPRTVIVVGMLLMAGGVSLGAFGAHVLKDTLSASGRTQTFDLATRYLVYHALSIILLGALMKKFTALRTTVIWMLVGVFFFCGSLLLVALTNEPSWGAVTPIGGTSLIVGWLVAAWSVYRDRRNPET